MPMKKKMKMRKKKKSQQTEQPAASSSVYHEKCPNCNFSGGDASDIDAHVRLTCQQSRGRGQIALPERTHSTTAKVYICGECNIAEPKSFRKIEDLEQHKADKHPKKSN